MKLLCIDDEDYEKLLDFFSYEGHNHENYDKLFDYAVDVDEKNYDMVTELIHKQLKIDELKRENKRLKDRTKNIKSIEIKIN